MVLSAALHGGIRKREKASEREKLIEKEKARERERRKLEGEKERPGNAESKRRGGDGEIQKLGRCLKRERKMCLRIPAAGLVYTPGNAFETHMSTHTLTLKGKGRRGCYEAIIHCGGLFSKTADNDSNYMLQTDMDAVSVTI